MFLAAVVQVTSTSDEAANWEQVEGLVARAAGHGARFIATPEATNYLGPHREKVEKAEPLDGPTVRHFGELARTHGVHLLLGSYNERSDEPDRCYNTAVLFRPDGTVAATYRKMHLFDVDHSEAVRFLESRTTKPGDAITVVETELGTMGLSICYDLRFPELYRAQVDRGARILCVPSAFTATTGQAHWHVLARARAVETQSWVIAPGQVGEHDDKGLKATYGHSLIVDPWGTVVAEVAGTGPGVAYAEIDLDRVARIRRAIPVQQNRRL
jgi:deaminated glutathione amidase